MGIKGKRLLGEADMASVPHDSSGKTSNFAHHRRTFILRVLITLDYSNITALAFSCTARHAEAVLVIVRSQIYLFPGVSPPVISSRT